MKLIIMVTKRKHEIIYKAYNLVNGVRYPYPDSPKIALSFDDDQADTYDLNQPIEPIVTGLTRRSFKALAEIGYTSIELFYTIDETTKTYRLTSVEPDTTESQHVNPESGAG